MVMHFQVKSVMIFLLKGDALTERLKVQKGAQLRHVVMGENTDKIVMASDAGYGFICQVDDLTSLGANSICSITSPCSFPKATRRVPRPFLFISFSCSAEMAKIIILMLLKG